MALDKVILNPGSGGESIATDEILGVNYEIVKVAFGSIGVATLVTPTDPLPVTHPKPSSSANTNVADNAANVTLLAANAARLGATIYNDSSATLYLKLGATATSSSFTVKMYADDYYEVPFGYTGRIDGIWASAAGGAARISELT